MSILGDDAKVTVRTKADLVRERIEEAILNGTLAPGDRVVVDTIVRETGVSKIPVREALGRLESTGVIVQTPNSGFRVAPLSLTDMAGVYLLRREVEGLAAELAASRISTDALDELRRLNAEIAARLDADETAGLSELNREFHVAIAAASGYQPIVDVDADLLRKVHRYRSVVARTTDDWRDTVAAHQSIIDALQSGDPSTARSLAADHAAHQLDVETRAELG